MSTVKANFITSSSGGGPSVKGENAGASKAAGYIGEVFSSTGQGSGITIGTTATRLATVSPTAGIWLAIAIVNVLETNAATNDGSFALGTTDASYTGTVLGYDQLNMYTLAANGRMSGMLAKVVNISSTTPYYLNCISRQGAAASGDWLGSLIFVRIA